MKKPFQFGIMSDSTHYYSIVGGVVTLSTTPAFLPVSVVDWKTLALNYRRDGVNLGVIRSYSPNMVRFVKDAAKILRYIKNTQGGGEAVAYLSVNTLYSTTQEYRLLDYWQIDFNKTNNRLNFFEAALMEGGLSALLKSYGGTNYNIPLNDPALAPDFPLYNPLPVNALPLTPPTNNPVPPPVPKLMYMDGIPILGRIDYTSDGPGDTISVIFTSPPIPDAAFSLTQYQELGDYSGSAGVVQDPITAGGIWKATADSKVSIEFNTKFTYDNSPGNVGASPKKANLHMKIFDSGSVLLTDVILAQDTVFIAGSSTSAPVHFFGKTDWYNLNAGDKIFITFSYTESSTGLSGERIVVHLDPTEGSGMMSLPTIRLDYSFVPQSSVVRVISQAQLFEYLTAMVATNGGILTNPYASRSNLLSTARLPAGPGNWDLDPSCTFFTCGDALRGLKKITVTDPYYNSGNPFDCYVVPAIYTNMNDFAKDLFTDLCASIGIEKTGPGTDTLVAEELSYFFDDSTVIADLGTNIKDFEMQDFNDYKGSSILIGQTDQQFDAINGPLESMSEVEYALPVTRINKKVDHKTPYRADPYGIELLRANIGNKTNINSSSDNDTVKVQAQNLTENPVTDLSNWGGLSGYSFTVNALGLKRATQIDSGLPSNLLIPEVNPYAMYNTSFSPQRKALRALPWLVSNYRGLPNSLMSIAGYKKNIKCVWNAGTGIITESDYINLSDAAQTYTPPFSTNPVTVQPAVVPAGKTTAQIFKDRVFFITSPVPVDLPTLMTPPGTPGGGKMYGKILFTFVRDNISYPLAGFVLEAGITPGTNASYRYKLLCSPTVNIPDTL